MTKKTTRKKSPSADSVDGLLRELKNIRRLRKRVKLLELAVGEEPEDASQTVPIKELMQELARTLLLTGDGERFERTIMEAIRDYKESRKELRRLSEHPDASEALRAEIVSSLTCWVSQCQGNLARLGVVIEEVAPGTELDADSQLVVKKLKTPHEGELRTVCQCVVPGFAWTTGQGVQRQIHPEVAAYTKLCKAISDEPAYSDANDDVGEFSFSNPR